MSELHEEVLLPKLVPIKGGWAAHGDGWAVHGKTPEEVREKYREMEALLARIAMRPYLYERTREEITS